MNSARVDIERPDGTATTPLPLDPRGLVAGPGPYATVSISVGTQVDFGRVKVTAHVSYQCDQNQATVDRAGLMAFEKAVSFMNDGLGLLVEPATP